jgi:hypothetical protein
MVRATWRPLGVIDPGGPISGKGSSSKKIFINRRGRVIETASGFGRTGAMPRLSGKMKKGLEKISKGTKL